jgi:hypothetical protein
MAIYWLAYFASISPQKASQFFVCAPQPLPPDARKSYARAAAFIIYTIMSFQM